MAEIVNLPRGNRYRSPLDDYIHLGEMYNTFNNEYIPAFALADGNYMNAGDKKGIIYRVTAESTHLYRIRYDRSYLTARHMLRDLVRDTRSTMMIDDIRYIVLQYFIAKINPDFSTEVLFSAVFPKEYAFNVKASNGYFHSNKMIFVFNKCILNDPTYVKLKRKMNKFSKETFQDADFVYTSDMTKWGFNPQMVNANFKTVTSMVDYFNKLRNL